MSDVSQAAYVLHSRPYKENQLLVELFTHNWGKVAAVTYISHSAKSEKKSLLQPFTPLNVSLSGKGQLLKLNRVEANGRSVTLTKYALFSGFYLNELLMKLLPERAASNELFHLYHQSMHSLANNSDLESILRNFEMLLLEELGESIDFASLNKCVGDKVQYIPNEGFCAVSSLRHFPIYCVSHMHAIAKQQALSKEERQSFKQLMRQVIEALLGGKSLQSRKLFTKG